MIDVLVGYFGSFSLAGSKRSVSSDLYRTDLWRLWCCGSSL